jgi:GAF domain-containing protein
MSAQDRTLLIRARDLSHFERSLILSPYLLTDISIAKVVRLACEIAEGYAASLFLVKGEVLVPYILYNLPRDYIAGIGEVRVGTQCCGRAVQSRKPWIVADMLTDPLFADGVKGAEASPIRAAFSVPVILDGEAIASLACHFRQAHAPSALDIDRNEHFARLLGIMIKGRGPLVGAHYPLILQAGENSLLGPAVPA